MRVSSSPCSPCSLFAAPARAGVTTLEPTYEVDSEENVAVPMADGTMLYADVYRLPKPKRRADQRFPCLFEMTPYRKELRAAEGAGTFPARGFVLMEIDARGTGGVGGEYDGVFTDQEQRRRLRRDRVARDEVPALQRPRSAASAARTRASTSTSSPPAPKGNPPHLQTIAPQRALTDLYRDIVYIGGIVTASFGLIWAGGTEGYNLIGADPRTNPPPEQARQRARRPPRQRPDVHDVPGASRSTRPSTACRRSSTASSASTCRSSTSRAGTTRSRAASCRAIGRLLELERAGSVEGPELRGRRAVEPRRLHFLDHEPFDRRLVEWYRHWLDGGPRPDVVLRAADHLLRDARGARRRVRVAAGRRVAAARTRAPPLVPPAPSGELGARAARTATASSARGTGTRAPAPARPASASGTTPPAPPQREADQAAEDEWKGLTFTTPPLERDLVVTGPMELRLRAKTDPLPGRRRRACPPG